MQFKIIHKTDYNYSEKVFFEPHLLRFKPKATPWLSVKNYSITIDPIPSGVREYIDFENNLNTLSWFNDVHHHLSIVTETVVEVQNYNPFSFLVYPSEYLTIPFEYNIKAKTLLKPALEAQILSKSILNFCQDILKDAKQQSVDFLLALTKQIHKEFSLETRETGEPHAPDYTFQIKLGSCRDLAWMQIQLLRHLGIAARFVSGYFYIEAEKLEFELHAWLEAYLPGAGWVGLDPSHGILTDVHHIAVATSAFYENTMPVSGTTRGEASSILRHSLAITVVK